MSLGPHILVIDAQSETSRALEEALEASALRVVTVSDIVSAKRRLVQERPVLIVCAASLGGDTDAAFRFCEELHAHETYRDIPVLLVSEGLTDEAIRRAGASGAKGMMPKPLQPTALRHRLQNLLPKEIVVPPPAAAESKPRPAPPPLEPQVEAEAERNFQLAQSLLAKVLHNLKTSDLLKIAEEDDVPRVVFEITRSVCGIRTAPAAAKPEAQTTLDLDRAFGRKG